MSKGHPQRRRQERLGFSLVELVLVLFLTGLILLIVGRLCQRTFLTLRTLQERAQTIQAATLGMERLGSELREAIGDVVITPLSLTFSKVDPAAPYGLDVDGPDANPGDLKPDFDFMAMPSGYASDADSHNQFGTIEYKLSDALLRRTASKDDRSVTTDVATNVNAFAVTPHPFIDGRQTPDNVFLISLSLTEQRRVQSFATIVIVPGVSP